jgi:hypothetical protein
MNLLVGLVAGFAQGIVRLIGNENERITRVLQLQQGGNRAVDEAEVGRPERGFGAPCGWVEDQWIQNAIAVEEDGGPAHRADSHFISLARS